MAVQVLFQALKSILFFFIGIWRRALCCFRGRRRMSCDSVPLTGVGVVSDYSKPNELVNWNNWEEPGSNSFKPSSVQEHIEYYRQQAIAAKNQSESADEIQDFFEDMTPRITQQTKVFVDDGSGDRSKGNSSRLSLAPQPIVLQGELGEWEENSGWEEQTQTDFDPQSILREKRRQERERRLWEQQQKRQEKVTRPLSLGAKIS